MDKMNTIGLIIILVTVGLFFKEINKLWRLLIESMFSQKSPWFNKYIEKPRTLLHAFSLFFVLVAFFLLSDLFFNRQIDYIDIIIGVFFYFFGILILLFTYTKVFEKKFIPLMENIIKNKSKALIYRILHNKDLELIFIKMEQLEQLPKDNIEKQKLIDKLTLFYIKKPTEKKPIKEKINITVSQKNKQVTYHPIFYFLNEIFEDGIIDVKINKKGENIYSKITRNKRKQLKKLIIENFKKDGEDIKKEALNTSYTDWKPKYDKNQEL